MELKNIIFMKYGVHAKDTPQIILNNKINEVSSCGQTFWGYGGNLCHPLTQVQPFIHANQKRGEKTYLLLSKINSVWNGSSARSIFYSYDNKKWIPIPEENIVTGARYALICNSFDLCEFDIDLSLYYVPLGNAKGRLLSDYIYGRVSKACGTFRFKKDFDATKEYHISAIAEIESAVFVQ